MFVIDESDRIVSHPDPERVGLDLKGWVGADANGCPLAPELLSATEEGRWVTSVLASTERGEFGPGATGTVALENVWAVRHGGLLFASGWHTADASTKALVATAVNTFRLVELEGTKAHFTAPRPSPRGWRRPSRTATAPATVGTTAWPSWPVSTTRA